MTQIDQGLEHWRNPFPAAYRGPTGLIRLGSLAPQFKCDFDNAPMSIVEIAQFRYATFFCGLGGTCSGAEAAGLSCAVAIDNNDRDPKSGKERLPAIQFRQRNFEDGRGVVMDINDFVPALQHAARYVFASPPCKRFSNAAETRDGNDDQQLLLDEELKNLGIVSIRKAMAIPGVEYYAMENVTGLLSAKNRPYLARMIDMLTNEHGCAVEIGILDAREFGLCQSRQRLFMVASRSGKRGLLPASRMLQPAKFEEIVDDDKERLIRAAWNASSYPHARAKEFENKGSIKWIVPNVESITKNGKWEKRAADLLDDVLPTVTCGWNGGPTRKKVAILDQNIGGTGIAALRSPTLLEGLRAQGFPECWLDNLEELPESKAWAMIGNAVPRPFSQAIAEHLIQADEDREASATRRAVRFEPDEIINS